MVDYDQIIALSKVAIERCVESFMFEIRADEPSRNMSTPNNN